MGTHIPSYVRSFCLDAWWRVSGDGRIRRQGTYACILHWPVVASPWLGWCVCWLDAAGTSDGSRSHVGRNSRAGTAHGLDTWRQGVPRCRRCRSPLGPRRNWTPSGNWFWTKPPRPSGADWSNSGSDAARGLASWQWSRGCLLLLLLLLLLLVLVLGIVALVLVFRVLVIILLWLLLTVFLVWLPVLLVLEVEEDTGKGQKQVRNKSETPKRQHLPSIQPFTFVFLQASSWR